MKRPFVCGLRDVELEFDGDDRRLTGGFERRDLSGENAARIDVLGISTGDDGLRMVCRRRPARAVSVPERMRNGISRSPVSQSLPVSSTQLPRGSMTNTVEGIITPSLATPGRSSRRKRLPRGMPLMSKTIRSIQVTFGLARRKASVSSRVINVSVMRTCLLRPRRSGGKARWMSGSCAVCHSGCHWTPSENGLPPGARMASTRPSSAKASAMSGSASFLMPCQCSEFTVIWSSPTQLLSSPLSETLCFGPNLTS